MVASARATGTSPPLLVLFWAAFEVAASIGGVRAASAIEPIAPSKASAPLRVMTFNILYAPARNAAGPWAVRRLQVADIIRSREPDVVGLQEVTDRQVADLTASLPVYEVLSGPWSGRSVMLPWAPVILLVGALAGIWIWRRSARDPSVPLRRRFTLRLSAVAIGIASILPVVILAASLYFTGPIAEQGERCSILYRADRVEAGKEGSFWISDTPERPGSVLRGEQYPHLVHWAVFRRKVDGAGFTVFNAHLGFLPWSVARIARTVERELNRRWDGSPQILMGDFNSAPDAPAFRILTGSNEESIPSPGPFCDTWTVAKRREGPAGTFHWGIGRSDWPGRIDFILVRPCPGVPRVTTITDHRAGTYPSDHYPYLAEVEL